MKEEDKKLMRILFPELQFETDDGLESWRAYAMRDLVQLRMEKAERWQLDSMQAFLYVVTHEVERRKELAKHGAPKYEGRDKVGAATVEDLKRHYTGDAFVNLFCRVTGFEVMPGGKGRMRYRCKAHGEDRDPSGVLYMDQGSYWCYACNAGGNIFSLIYQFPPHLTFREAVKQLQEWAFPYRETEPGKWRRTL